MKSRVYFPLEFRFNLASSSEIPENMVRRFCSDYYIDSYKGHIKDYKSKNFYVHGFEKHVRVCKMVEDKALKGWYHITHLVLERLLPL